jgi:hypothetical protein
MTIYRTCYVCEGKDISRTFFINKGNYDVTHDSEEGIQFDFTKPIQTSVKLECMCCGGTGKIEYKNSMFETDNLSALYYQMRSTFPTYMWSDERKEMYDKICDNWNKSRKIFYMNVTYNGKNQTEHGENNV